MSTSNRQKHWHRQGTKAEPRKKATTQTARDPINSGHIHTYWHWVSEMSGKMHSGQGSSGAPFKPPSP